MFAYDKHLWKRFSPKDIFVNKLKQFSLEYTKSSVFTAGNNAFLIAMSRQRVNVCFESVREDHAHDNALDCEKVKNKIYEMISPNIDYSQTSTPKRIYLLGFDDIMEDKSHSKVIILNINHKFISCLEHKKKVFLLLLLPIKRDSLIICIKNISAKQAKAMNSLLFSQRI